MNAATTDELKVERVVPNALSERALGSRSRLRLRSIRSTLALFSTLVCGAFGLSAAEVIPPAPRDHFNDYAGIVRADTARQLETELTQFERETSNQILVAIYPHMQSDSSIEDYTFRVKEAWKVGLKGKNNGAVLFIFSQDRKLFVQVGYGLEGPLPDALCKRIIEEEITPRFRQGDFTGGTAAGVHALLAAARGEYQGTGRTVADRNRRSPYFGGGNAALFFFVIIASIVISLLRRVFRRNTLYTGRGRRSPWITTGSWGGGSWGGGSSGGWSGGGGGGGSFSGGGGSGGGGGAGGSW